MPGSHQEPNQAVVGVLTPPCPVQRPILSANGQIGRSRARPREPWRRSTHSVSRRTRYHGRVIRTSGRAGLDSTYAIWSRSCACGPITSERMEPVSNEEMAEGADDEGGRHAGWNCAGYFRAPSKITATARSITVSFPRYRPAREISTGMSGTTPRPSIRTPLAVVIS